LALAALAVAAGTLAVQYLNYSSTQKLRAETSKFQQELRDKQEREALKIAPLGSIDERNVKVLYIDDWRNGGDVDATWCLHRSKVDADSDPKWTPVPIESGQGFRLNLDSVQAASESVSRLDRNRCWFSR
jgi:hypothetical protein